MKPIKSGGDFKQAPAGPHPAILYSLIDLGTQESNFNGQVGKPKRRITMRFELHGDDCKMDDGRPLSIGKSFTLSSHSKGNLRPFMESWRSKAFTDEEFENFDLQNMLGKPCILTLVEDGDYMAIEGISKLLSGMTPPLQVNKNVYFNLDQFDRSVFDGLSDKLKETIRLSPEWKKLNGLLPPDAPVASNEPPFSDEIPF